MKLKGLILGIFIGIFGIGICNAGQIYSNTSNTYNNTSSNNYDLGNGGCFGIIDTNGILYYTFEGGTQQTVYRGSLMCGTGTVSIRINNQNYKYGVRTGINFSATCQTCPTCEICETCEEQYTSLECQTEYNLIPISNVTANYCIANFNLIDPSSCPINEGTGSINWSALYINSIQYASNDNININIPQDIAWSLTYTTGDSYVDIEGYNADGEYIEDIISKTKVTPTNEDVSYLVNGLQEYLPYVMLSMLFLFFLYLIRKVFK